MSQDVTMCHKVSQGNTKCHKMSLNVTRDINEKSHKKLERRSNANEFLSRMFHLQRDGVDHRLVDSKVSPQISFQRKLFKKKLS